MTDYVSIKIGVTLPGWYDSYQHCREKPRGSLLVCHGWTGANESANGLAHHIAMQAQELYHNMHWLEDCRVLDANKDEALPGLLYVLVAMHGNGSWYARDAFVSKEEAEKAAKEWSYYRDGRRSWYWAVGCRRFALG